jgi:glycosyltransferase involved in cell wall biosynthesis
MKLLYITGQFEGKSHSSISGIFGKYLRSHMSVVRVFISSRIDTTCFSDDDIFIPSRFKDNIFQQIEKYVDIKSIDYVLIRNYYRYLKQALRLRKNRGYNFLIGLQQSHPFAFVTYYVSMKHDRLALKRWIKAIDYQKKEYGNRRLLSKADFFVPISLPLHQTFHQYYQGKLHPLGMGVDPCLVRPDRGIVDHQLYKFIYIGSVTHKIREFDTILKGFADLEGNWEFDIFTRDYTETMNMLTNMNITDRRIKINKAIARESLFAEMQKYDVGINLMPDNLVWQTASPTKLMEYYGCGIPCIMSPITECRGLFEDKGAGWFCEFESGEIRGTVRKVLATPKSELVAMGENGRRVVMENRNYKKMSEDLFLFLQRLVQRHSENQ